MAMKTLTPGSHRLPRPQLHSVRFTNDDVHSLEPLYPAPRREKREYQESQQSSLPASTSSCPGGDSGAGSPDSQEYQPAQLRYNINEQRIKLLTAINQIVQQRADLEQNKATLSSLLEELRRKLKRRVEECQSDKKDKLKMLKQSNLKLERERSSLVHELEHLGRHLEKEESHHVQHARTVVAQAIQGVAKGTGNNDALFAPCSLANLPAAVCRSVAKNAPSRVADNKLAAARLMRDIAELRQRVGQVETRLTNELKRKRQAELDIVRLRKELSTTKSSVASLRLPPPSYRNQCSKFA
ncbi:uncharacterized protein LOC105380747 [Plutella xylostella]|uniref:uncharacterized protein LOC105380747 n=1 Tax=Plutella xylostella TaxID=51655 RepID=UPI0018CFF730|nr:uncharacterized protein LOC105380747 [Plutella xylostella]